MANYKGGTATICPYYEKEADKSITCQGAIENCSHMNRFNTKEDKIAWQDKVCSTYDYISCPIAKMIEGEEKKEQKTSDVGISITDNEKAIYDYIVAYTIKNLVTPTIREICNATFYGSTKNVYKKLRILHNKGLIELKKTKSRNIKLMGYELIKL